MPSSSQGNYDLWVRAGKKAARIGDLTGAISAYEQALALKPNDSAVLFALGNLGLRSGMYDLAAQMFQIALQFDPSAVEIYNNLALAQFRSGDPALAISTIKQGLAIRADDIELWLTLANANVRLGQFQNAIKGFEEALRLQSNSASAYAGLGDVLYYNRLYSDAVPYYQRAVKLSRDRQKRTDIEMNLSLALMGAGRLSEAWTAYEARFKAHGRNIKYTHGVKAHRQQSLTDKSVLVVAEQGLGDEIEMASILPDLIAEAGKVVIAVDPRLVAIYQRSFPAADVTSITMDNTTRHRVVRVDRQKELGKLDFALPSAGLARLYRQDISAFPRQQGYLKANPDLCAKWSARLTAAVPENMMKSGLCWRSGNVTGTRKFNYLPLDQHEPLFQVSECGWINLQYGECRAELAHLEESQGVKILDFADLDQFNDLENVFALIHELDFVVSEATAVSTFAGALGVPSVRLATTQFSCGHDPVPFAPCINAVAGDDRVLKAASWIEKFKVARRTEPSRNLLRRQYAMRSLQPIPDPQTDILSLMPAL